MKGGVRHGALTEKDAAAPFALQVDGRASGEAATYTYVLRLAGFLAEAGPSFILSSTPSFSVDTEIENGPFVSDSRRAILLVLCA